MIFKIIIWIIRAVSPPIEMDSLSLVKLWADLFHSFLPETLLLLKNIFNVIPTLVFFT